MKPFLLSLVFALSFVLNTNAQCPDNDFDGDGVLDCIDPCPNAASSKIGNLSFESDFVGWTIPQNSGSFSISNDLNNSLHGSKSLYVTAPNAATFEGHAIYTNEFTLEEGVSYNFKIPVKRVGNVDGDALRWALVDENGVYRHFNNYYTFTENWTYITFENFQANFDFYTSNKFRLRLEFGLSTTDMVVDKIEFYETSQIVDPAYLDMDADGNPDCVPFSAANHPDYDALVSFYNALNGSSWFNSTNWLDTTKPLSLWYGVTETNGRVTHINLTNNNLNGILPESIDNLNALITIDLGLNNLTGEIPDSIANIATLEILGLGQNNLSGNVPDNLALLPNLSRLTLGQNNLSGKLPDFTPQNLFVLTIDNNFFEFGDFENEFLTYQNNITQFYYTPQKLPTIPPDSRIITLGNDISVNSTPVSGNNNIYSWYSNGEIVDSATHPNITGLDTPNINIETITNSQLGRYECYVTNSVVTNMEIYAGTFNLGLEPEEHPDYDALVALYNALNGQFWSISNHNWLDNTKPISSWWGITETNGRVTGIQLSQGNVWGSIPNEITTLTELELFWIQNAFVSGEIPANIGNLTKLRQLVLNQTYGLTGNIPASIINCTNLEWLYVPRNQLKGDIPDLTSLSNLSWLNITNNNFVFADFEDEYSAYLAKLGNGGFQYSPQNQIDETKGIAANIGETITLNTLPNLGTNTTAYWYKINDLGESEFLGSGNSINVPVQLEDDYTDYYYRVTSSIITTFSLESNRITIGPPPENHPDYDALIAIYNALDGPNWNKPWDITAPINTWSTWDLTFDNTTNRVIDLNLGGNDKMGQLPKEIGDLTTLTSLYIRSSENISGVIPPEIGNLSNLINLYLWHCDFSGEIPTELWSLANLQSMFIGNQKSNALTLNNGLPMQVSNLQNLQLLDLNGIPISGNLPNELFSLPNLDYILLNNCGLDGQLPEQFASINQVHLSNNNFEGNIPQPIVDATGNRTLNISGNYFDFNDLEPLVQANNYSLLNYSPQRTKDTELDLEFAPGEDITLSIDDTRHNKSKNSKGVGDIYQWFKDGAAITGANASSYTITNAQETDSGVYHCEITNNLVPDLIIVRADIALLIDASLSINENQKNNFSVYPNPTNGILNIKLNEVANAKMKLLDIQGRYILGKELSSQNTVIDMSNLNSGTYLLQIQGDNFNTTKRIVKQ